MPENLRPYYPPYILSTEAMIYEVIRRPKAELAQEPSPVDQDVLPGSSDLVSLSNRPKTTETNEGC